MRVVVLGGFGNFGARICRALAHDAGIEVLAAGRTARGADGVQLDLAASDFPASLKRLAPVVVIHCAGPFQGQDYRVAAAAIGAGAHYIDLADGREFVACFAARNDSAARAAGLAAISGASTVPAGTRPAPTSHRPSCPGPSSGSGPPGAASAVATRSRQIRPESNLQSYAAAPVAPAAMRMSPP